MPDSVTSTNMLMPVPVVGTAPGPQYATDLNSCLGIIDTHDHTTNAGVQIPSAGININANLPFNDNNAITLRSARFTAQTSPLAVASDLGCLYVSGADLYFNDTAGNQVRITQSGGVAGSPGSIAGLSSPASATYVSGSQTFVWQSGASAAANMDAGSLLLRNLTPNSTYAVTISPPAALSSNYTLTLPSIPAAQKFMTLDNTGAISAPWAVDASTLEISSNTLQIKDSGVTTAKINNLAVTTAKINDGAVTQAKRAALGQQIGSVSGSFSTTSTVAVTVTNCSVTITTTGRPVMLLGMTGTIGGDSVTVTTDVFFGFKRDSTVLSAHQVYSGPLGGAAIVRLPGSSLAFVDTPGAGTYTYTIYAYVNGAGSTAIASNLQLCAYEL